MKNKEVMSALVGGTFFAIPYIGLSIAMLPSLVIGCAAFGASELVLSGINPPKTLKNSNRSLYQKIVTAKQENREIKNLIAKVSKEDTKDNLIQINDTVSKIIEVVEKNPKKEKYTNNFFDYYLPVLIKIVNRYDEIEDNKLESTEGKKFMEKADKMIKDTNRAFEMILSSLYQNDIMDADADMKVYEMMMKADGIVDDNLILKGEKDEK